MEIINPAHLSFLAIYSPALGPTDETLPDQLVYYHNGRSEPPPKDEGKSMLEARQRAQQNEQLRNIGLAQGMINFGRSFSDGDDVDFVDSEKYRIFMHELEPGWWVLGSVALTQLRTTTTVKNSKGKTETKAKIEYSGREVSSHTLLLQQILNAHDIFLLHHGPSLAEIYQRLKRPKFCAALDRFWSGFLRDWDVLLHGNPTVDIFPGIKLATGGELGVGVGEEEWGSGERDVLEDFTRRTDGLIDVVVSHFQDADTTAEDRARLWLGSGSLPVSSDGVIYSGTGKVSRKSVAGISKWMQLIYKHGSATYGVQDSPHAPKRKRRQKQSSKTLNQDLSDWPSGIPPPLLAVANDSLAKATSKIDKSEVKEPAQAMGSTPGTDKLMKYMTFGLYGSGWGLPTDKPSVEDKKPANEEMTSPKISSMTAPGTKPKKESSPAPKIDINAAELQKQNYFLIGLQGDLDEDDQHHDDDPNNEDDGDTSLNQRILLRTLYVELNQPGQKTETFEQEPTIQHDRVQVLVYINQPFIFTFLFELNTPTLNYSSFYRSLHHQLGPLRRPLLRSTSSHAISNRLNDVVSPRTVSSNDNKQPIYDLIYDPANYTIHTTIPPIPDTNNPVPGWSRLDALNVHLQIVSTQSTTRRQASELERTAKTSRGWWVVWMKFTPGEHKDYKEAFLVRKASDYIDENGRKGSFGLGKDVANWGSSAGRVAEGIGIDARRYVEGLISLSR